MPLSDHSIALGTLGILLLATTRNIYRDRIKTVLTEDHRVTAIDKRLTAVEAHIGLMWTIVVMGKAPELRKPIHKEMDDLLDKAVAQAMEESMGRVADILSIADEDRLRVLLWERFNDTSEINSYRSNARLVICWLDYRQHMRTGECVKDRELLTAKSRAK